MCSRLKGFDKFRRCQGKIDHSRHLLDHLRFGHYDVDHFTLFTFYAAKSCSEKYFFRDHCRFVFFKGDCLYFFLVDDLRRVIQWAAGKLFFSNTEGETMEQGVKISRSVFLSWAGMIVGGGLFSSLVYGLSNKYRYRTHRVQLAFDNLPRWF
jgi:hypothetical protein